MELTKYVACICEGAAEAAIMRTLLDHDRLIFTYDDLLDGDILRCRSAKNFEEQHLRKGFTEKITVRRFPMNMNYVYTAAANSTEQAKQSADFICTGIHDEQTIQQAIFAAVEQNKNLYFANGILPNPHGPVSIHLIFSFGKTMAPAAVFGHITTATKQFAARQSAFPTIHPSVSRFLIPI